jgi:hypothetical protein
MLGLGAAASAEAVDRLPAAHDAQRTSAKWAANRTTTRKGKTSGPFPAGSGGSETHPSRAHGIFCKRARFLFQKTAIALPVSDLIYRSAPATRSQGALCDPRAAFHPTHGWVGNAPLETNETYTYARQREAPGQRPVRNGPRSSVTSSMSGPRPSRNSQPCASTASRHTRTLARPDCHPRLMSR